MRGTQLYLAAHGPALFGRLGVGLLLSTAVLLAAMVFDQPGLIPIGLGVLIIVLLLTMGWLYAIFLRYDAADPQPQIVMQLAGISSTDQVTVVELGQRHLALALSRYLSTGRLNVVDIFNPQIFDRSFVNRWRSVMPEAIDDPRLVWRTGTFDLLPIRDSTQDVVVLPEVLSELVQEGDRQILVEEVYRILRPGGRIIVIEPLASITNRVLLGVGSLEYQSMKTWLRLLDRADYLRLQELRLNDVIGYIRGEKLEPMQGIQLPLIR